MSREPFPKRENVRVTASGLDRIPGAKVGDVYLVDSFTPAGDGIGYCAHVRDYSRQSTERPFAIWTLGNGDWS
jgi:hypothetical protein